MGAEDLADRIQNEGFTDFDVAIATPDMMPVVGRLGRILGPQGKMPNPKVGTVTMDVGKAVEESKAGKVEYRTDRTAIVHMTVGKTSFDDKALLENYQAVIDELIRAKPSVAKGKYLRTIVMASTQGPGHQGRSRAHPTTSWRLKRPPQAEREARATLPGRRNPVPPETPGSRKTRTGDAFEPRPESRGHRGGDRPVARSATPSTRSTTAARPCRRRPSCAPSCATPTRASASSRTRSPSAPPTTPAPRR